MALLVMSCAPQVSEDLIDYVKKIQEEKRPYKEDLPHFKKFQPLKYTANTFRDPFVPYEAQIAAEAISTIPDIARKREPLEAYALEDLSMVGTLEQEGIFYALLKDATGAIHRVGVGNYIGQSSGRIESISMNEINIKQLGTDSRGGWREFPVTVYLQKATSIKDTSSKTKK